jgi:hypothetical protein
MRDQEQDVVAAQKYRLDGKEVARDDARGLRAQKLAPARPLAPRRRPKVRPGEQAADACRRYFEAELAKLAANPPLAPARVLAGKPQHQLLNLDRKRRPTTPHRRLPPLASHKRPVPAKQRPWSDHPGSRSGRGSWQAAAESSARSAGLSFGRAT